ncbi:MAG: glycosyltransferase [Saprospiraceae bacterium]|nr:glycosyltransferase [Saprospiraceae bacterium]
MRLIWLTPGFPADENDHACIPPLQLLARELAGRGAELDVVTLEYPFRSAPYQWHGIRVWPCDGRNRTGCKLRTLRRAFQHGLRLTAGQPAVLHSFWLGWAARTGERLHYRTGLPHLTTLMGQDVLPSNHKHLRYLTAKDEGRIVALSAFHRKKLEETTGLIALHDIPWGIDAREVPRQMPETRPFDVLGVGSLLPVKDWPKWLRTLRRVADRYPALRAELVGDGPEKKRIERLAASLGLERHLQLTGMLPRERVLEKMRSAKVLLHTARFESYGFVLVEAAAQGCRVVGTPVGIAPETGHTADDPAALAALVLAALAEPAPTAPFVPFSLRDTATRYLDLYGSMLSFPAV